MAALHPLVYSKKKASRSLVFFGESGSGKTESLRFSLEFIAYCFSAYAAAQGSGAISEISHELEILVDDKNFLGQYCEYFLETLHLRPDSEEQQQHQDYRLVETLHREESDLWLPISALLSREKPNFRPERGRVYLPRGALHRERDVRRPKNQVPLQPRRVSVRPPPELARREVKAQQRQAIRSVDGGLQGKLQVTRC